MKKLTKLPKSFAWIFVLGVVAGLIAVAVFRFVSYKSDAVHYHANFNVYVNGKRDEFNGPGYYEEVQSCMNSHIDHPEESAHLHDNVYDLVHVHSEGVTWGNFFANLGYTLGDNVFAEHSEVFVDGQADKKLVFVLNGKQVDSIANKIINSEDVLLINYGSEKSKIVESRFNGIPRTAHQHNTENDPSTCSGSKKIGFWERVKLSIGLKL